jgi:tetratricopeptide (TPR) repeat protein
MTLSPPNIFKLLAPIAVFASVLAVLLATGGGDAPVAALRAAEAPAGGAVAGATSLPDEGAPTGDAVADFQRAVRAAPESGAAYAGLGDAYLARARETGDPSFYARADRAFDAALRRSPDDLEALIGAGTLAGLRHDFAEQLRIGRRAVAQAPELARPYTVVADAQIELGRYDAAARTIQLLVDRKPGLASYARASYYRELSGDLAGAVSAMKLAVSAGGSAGSAAYVSVLLGDLELQRGRIEAARAAYTDALRTLPGSPAGLVGLARAEMAGGSPEGAAARLRRPAARLPLPRTLTLLAEIERTLDNEGAAEAALAAARAQIALVGGDAAGAGSVGAAVLPDAEAVTFAADHGSSPAAAVRLGRRVWRVAPSVRSADALGWALTRAGRPVEGYRFAQRALRLGSRDPVFRLHAGIAAKEAGLARPAARHFAIAAAGSAALSPDALDLLRRASR